MFKVTIDQVNYESLAEMHPINESLVEWLCLNSLTTLGRSWDSLAVNTKEALEALWKAQERGIDKVTLITDDGEWDGGFGDESVCHIYGGSLEQLSRELKKLRS